MKFNRNAPGEGVEVICRMENGKVHLEWKVSLVGKMQAEEYGAVEDASYIHMRLVDKKGNIAVECVQDCREDEPLLSVLLNAELWQGVENPCLYELWAVVCAPTGVCLDEINRKLPLRCLDLKKLPHDTGEQLMVNGEVFECRAVEYYWEEGQMEKECRKILKDWEKLLELGANCICLYGGIEKEFKNKAEGECVRNEELRRVIQLGEELGFLVGRKVVDKKQVCVLEFIGGAEKIRLRMEDELPLFCAAHSQRAADSNGVKEEEAACTGQSFREVLFKRRGNRLHPTSCYYKYLAKWGKEPFVYIVPESIKCLPSGNYKAVCYSNTCKVALYSDGKFFEVKSGEGEFVFWEIPSNKPCLMLSAEGDGCSTSFSFHRTFTKLSRIGDN